MNLSPAHKVLIAPLNWGLGHTARCLPIIDYYLKQGAEVHLASDGDAAEFLIERHPELPCHILPAFTIEYGDGYVYKAIIRKLPKFWQHIKADKQMCAALQKEHHFDLIISDSRYGFRNRGVKTVFLSHQLFIQTPIAAFIPSYILSKFINHFSELWVPDEESSMLSGALSRDSLIKIPVKYIGFLSRFSKLPKTGVVQNTNAVTVILSGPYPSKEEMFLKCIPLFNNHRKKLFTVFTATELKLEETIPTNVSIHLKAPDDFIWNTLCRSEKIICSAGYSTLMELAELKLISKYLIPKKGQTEQEYLSKHLNGKLGFKALKKGSHF